MKSILAVALGGGIGSVCRYLISLYLQQRYSYSFPWHTLFVNITGCMLIGALFPLFRQQSQSALTFFVLTGLLGGYTTFSSFGLETIQLLRSSRLTAAFTYVLLSNLAGLAVLYFGLRISEKWLS